jgi:hypothetical protein
MMLPPLCVFTSHLPGGIDRVAHPDTANIHAVTSTITACNLYIIWSLPKFMSEGSCVTDKGGEQIDARQDCLLNVRY